jgi:hypothetical protein
MEGIKRMNQLVSCKTKRGLSTVLGVLLGVGILFTTVIPLFLYVNSVNNYYDATVVNMGIADQERSMEDLIFYTYGHTDEGDELFDLFIINPGSITLNVTHVWVVRTDLEDEGTLVFSSQNVSAPINGVSLPLQLAPSNQMTIQNLTVTTILDTDPDKNYFNVYITTARGNKFPSSTNPLHKNGNWGTSGNWPWIDVRINSDDGSDDFTINIKCDTIGYDESWFAYHINGPYSLICKLPDIGAYNVTAWRDDVNLGTHQCFLTVLYPIAYVYYEDPPHK